MDHFEIENFRSLKGQHFFNFSPCNLLTGPNNSGKSSLIKGILWCIEAFNGRQIPIYPDLENPNLNLGNNSTVLNSSIEAGSLSFLFPIISPLINSIRPLSRSFIKYDFYKRRQLTLNNLAVYATSPLGNADEDLIINIYFDNGRVFCEVNFFYIFRNLYIHDDYEKKNVTLFEYSENTINTSLDQIINFESSVLNELMKSPLSELYDYGDDSNNPFNWGYLIGAVEDYFRSLDLNKLYISKLNFIKADELVLSEHGKQFIEIVEQMLKRILQYGLRSPLGNISYIKPDRSSQKRVYFSNDVDLASSLFLSYPVESYDAAHKNFNSGDDPYQKNKFNPEDWEIIRIAQLNENVNWNRESNQIRFINKWLKNLGICNDSEFFYVKKYYKYSCEPVIENKVTGVVRNLADYGFGTNQLVVLLLAVANSKGMVILEEPETNLHPDFQSKLADIIVDAINLLHRQFLIETHSEYLIRKLQYHVATYYKKSDSSDKFNKDSVTIYYFNRPDSNKEYEQKIDKIHINRDGRLTKEFGPGFLDESTRIIFDIWNLPGQN